MIADDLGDFDIEFFTRPTPQNLQERVVVFGHEYGHLLPFRRVADAPVHRVALRDRVLERALERRPRYAQVRCLKLEPHEKGSTFRIGGMLIQRRNISAVIVE